MIVFVIGRFKNKFSESGLVLNNVLMFVFQVFEPILNRRDWELILQGAKIVSYKKGDFIIKQGEDQHQRIFHIITGNSFSFSLDHCLFISLTLSLTHIRLLYTFF
jgi:hypothetical protein